VALLGNGTALPRRTVLFLGAALSLAATPAGAQPLVLRDGDAPRVIGEVATFLEDPTGQLDATGLLAPGSLARFRPVPAVHPNLGYTRSTIWLRFSLQNGEKSEREFVLDVGREWLESVLLLEEGEREGRRSGAWIPLHQRPVPVERIAFFVELPPGATRSYLLSIASRTPVSLLGAVVPREAFMDGEATRNLAFGGFYAILFALAAYNLIVSLVAREGTHALLGGALLSYALAEACAHGHVSRFFPAVAGFAELSGCSAAFGAFTGCFGTWAHRAFEVADRLRRLDRAFRVAIAGSVLCCALAALFPRLHLLTFVGLLLLIAALLPGTVLRVRQADRVGLYLAIAIAALLVPGSAVIGALVGLWPLNPATEQGNHYGAVVMACLFSLVTGERMRMATRKLIALNEELRRQVASRSRELALAYLPPGGGAAHRLLEEGELIDRRYRVARLLGQGGGGAVYQVIRIADARPLAIKVLVQVTGVAAARLLREAEIGARLSHPNLISILDVGITEAGNPFLAMELVTAGSLDRQRHRFGDVAWASPLLGGIAEGLVTLHAAGVVHRDLKPPNILLATERLPKIADFGIASIAEEQLARDSAGGNRTLTANGAILGTPAYMAPEAWDGVGQLGKPADVFAMGLLAYEMLSGKCAFEVPPFLQRAAGRPLIPPPPLQQRVPALSPALSRTIQRALSEDAEARPDMGSFAVAVHAALGS
jgi:protein kinase-like protein/7TMR-DISM extracellular protein 2/7TM protein involved in diverse intracellular signaling